MAYRTARQSTPADKEVFPGRCRSPLNGPPTKGIAPMTKGTASMMTASRQLNEVVALEGQKRRVRFDVEFSGIGFRAMRSSTCRWTAWPPHWTSFEDKSRPIGLATCPCRASPGHRTVWLSRGSPCRGRHPAYRRCFHPSGWPRPTRRATKRMRDACRRQAAPQTRSPKERAATPECRQEFRGRTGSSRPSP